MLWRFKALFCIAAGFLIINMYGCSFSGSRSVSENRGESRDLEEKEETVSDMLPVSGNSQTEHAKAPRVLTGLNGYAPDDNKTAYFLDGEEGGAFFVVDASTRETVYTGRMTGSGQKTSEGRRY